MNYKRLRSVSCRMALPAVLVMFSWTGFSQVPTISTYVGIPLPVSGQPASSQNFDLPASAVSDGSGGFYLSSAGHNKIYRIAADGTLSIVAGTGVEGYSGNNSPAISAQLNRPTGLARDALGTLFVADTGNHVIRKITPDGVISTVAGSGTDGFSGDFGAATNAKLDTPIAVTVDAAGTIYIADARNSRIRKVTGGVITTFAGAGTRGFSGDGGAAASAQLYYPIGVALDAAGNVYIADSFNSRVRRVTAGGRIDTVAGGGTGGLGDGGTATAAALHYPSGITFDANGNLLIPDAVTSRIRKVTTSGVITTIAGDGSAGFRGDGGPAGQSRLNYPVSISVDGAGNMLVADIGNARVRRISADGAISTVAGNGASGFPGDGDYPAFVVSDGAGGAYYSLPDQNRVYRVLANGSRSLVAGTGASGSIGDGGSADQAELYYPTGLARDSAGNLYIADTANNRIRKIAPNGVINTVAGTGNAGFNGDGGPATAAQLSFPFGVALDAAGNLLIADTYNARVRKVTAAGVISTFAGGGTVGLGDGGQAAAAQLGSPSGLALDANGNVYIADFSDLAGIESNGSVLSRVRRVTPAGVISTFAGGGTNGLGDTGPAISAQLFGAASIAVAGDGSLYIAESGNSRIRKVTAGTITTVAGPGTGILGDGGAATSATLHYPFGVAVDSAGTVFVADTGNARVRKVVSGVITTAVGDGTFAVAGDVEAFIHVLSLAFVGPDIQEWLELRNTLPGINGGVLTFVSSAGEGGGFKGDGGPAVLAQVSQPQGLVFDSLGNLIIADSGNNRVRKVTPAGVITTIAGNGSYGDSGDGGLATSAQLSNPYRVAVDVSGNVFIADSGNNRIRKVTPAGIISTVAGNGLYGFGGISGNGGPATAASIGFPAGVTVDAAGNLYIADTGNNQIRKVGTDGIIRVFAGTGEFGFAGDGGPATAAKLASPYGLTLDGSGNLYFVDSNNMRVRKVTAAGVISTVAGNGAFGFSGDGGQATSAKLGYPIDVAADAAGNLLIADQYNSRIRKVTSGLMTTIAGTGEFGFSGDGGPATSAQLNTPQGVAFDKVGNVFVGDTYNSRVRKLTYANQTTYSITDRGALSLRSLGQFPTVAQGFAGAEPGTGAASPSGVAIYGYRQNNTLVTEVGVPGTPVIRSGRMYVETSTRVNSGIAIANPNNQTATITYYFTDLTGTSSAASSLPIPAGGQIAAYLNGTTFNGGTNANGTFTFSSNVPVAAVALRGLTNERSEFITTSLPITDLNATLSAGPIIMAYFYDGAGWTSQIILVNPGDTALSGTIQFVSTTGSPIAVTVGTQTNSVFNYSIPPRSSQKFQTAGAAVPSTGSVRVTPGSGTATPSALTVFSYRNNNVTITEASVPANPTGTAFRMYVDTAPGSGGIGSTLTGFAIANGSSSSANVTFEVTKLDGSSTGLTGTLTLLASGEFSGFLSGIQGLSSLPATFRGLVRISSTAQISVIGLRGRYNERGEYLTTTLAPSNEASTSAGAIYFPQIVDGAGYTTEFILFSGQPGQAPSGQIRFFSQNGTGWNGIIQ